MDDRALPHRPRRCAGRQQRALHRSAIRSSAARWRGSISTSRLAGRAARDAVDRRFPGRRLPASRHTFRVDHRASKPRACRTTAASPRTVAGRVQRQGGRAAGRAEIERAPVEPQPAADTGAEIDTKPELEIYADDVQCSHGATTGQLDPDALFYLRSRGLSEPEARSAADARLRWRRAFAVDVARYASHVHDVARPPAGPACWRWPHERRHRHDRSLPTGRGVARRRAHPPRLPDPGAHESTASRSSTSTTPPRASGRRPSSTRCRTTTRRRTPTCTAACTR